MFTAAHIDGTSLHDNPRAAAKRFLPLCTGAGESQRAGAGRQHHVRPARRAGANLRHAAARHQRAASAAQVCVQPQVIPLVCDISFRVHVPEACYGGSNACRKPHTWRAAHCKQQLMTQEEALGSINPLFAVLAIQQPAYQAQAATPHAAGGAADAAAGARAAAHRPADGALPGGAH